MAFSQMFATLSLCITLALFVTPSYSIDCSQKFTGKTFANCVELLELGAYLHYTYNSTNSSLSIAFVNEPDKPDGWIAWAINPKATGMIGSQALLAYKSNTAVVVKTYDITAYGPLKESKLSFDVWDLSGESIGDDLVIFAKVKVPEKATEVNQVWQVGPSVVNDTPGRHEMEPENMKSKGVLRFAAGGSPSVPGSSGGSGSTTPSAGSTTLASSGSVTSKFSLVSFFGGIGLIGSFVGF